MNMSKIENQINRLKEELSKIAIKHELSTGEDVYSGNFEIYLNNKDILHTHIIRIKHPSFQYNSILKISISDDWLNLPPDIIDRIKRSWYADEDDAFQIETKDYDYYYALKSRLDKLGDHWYKINKKTEELIEVNQSEIVDLVINHPEQILSKCSCIRIVDNKLDPLVRENGR